MPANEKPNENPKVRDAAEWLASDVPADLPLLILKSTVLFPLQVVSAQIANKQNLRMLDQYPSPDDIVGAGVLIDPEGPYARRNLGPMAVACRILNRVRMGHGTAQVVLQGLRRVEIGRIIASRPYLRARVTGVIEPEADPKQTRDRIEQLTRLVKTLVRLDDRYTDEFINVIQLNLENGSRLADLVADTVKLGYAEKRQVLETADVSERLGLLVELLDREVARARLAGEVRAKTEVSIHRGQREMFLREQLKIIRKELEELDPTEKEIAALEAKLAGDELPAIIVEDAHREAERLRDSTVRAREGSAIRTYVDWVLSMPWEKTAKEKLDLRRARRILDERYLGLGTARDRLLEFLAVRKLRGSNRLPLLAIMGPPGTGRTSLGRTMAEILGRPFVRISMHGVKDESEIRGSPRSEVAARPGPIVDGVRNAGVRNPVILIDNIDQLDPEGTAMVALLEALDPTLNDRFRDRYLGTFFNLSPVQFVITANVEEDIPDQLWDFVYVVELSGYTEAVKIAIAQSVLWPKALEEHGLSDRKVGLAGGVLQKILRRYTREAGVRELRSRLQTICRRLALKAAMDRRRRLLVDSRNLEDYLGRPVFSDDLLATEPQIGATMGLAWTDAGGDLLPIEALLMPGEGYIMLTGLLGETLQESAEAALSYVRSRGDELGIPADTFKEKDLHVHFPEGAIPKDGPSAGIAVATTIASLLSRRPVRHDFAMTGEISLRGRVLPVGGIREKVLAAYRARIRHVVLPKGNENDLSEVPQEVRRKVRIHLAGSIDEVFALALEKKARPAPAAAAARRRRKPAARRKAAKGRRRNR